MISLIFAFVAAFSGQAFADAKPIALGTVSEMLMPPYQSAAMERELPAADLRFANAKQLWVIGQDSLFLWDVDGRKLKRLTLTPENDKTEIGPLALLGTDGISMFAAADGALFQVGWEQGRVLRYQSAAATVGRPLALDAAGDTIWLVHNNAVLSLDRYGKKLKPVRHVPLLQGVTKAVIDANAKVLWFVKGKRLFRLAIDREDVQPAAVLEAKHALLDLELSGSSLVVPTAHTVLLLSPEGKLERSIPVEGSRKLLAVHVSKDAHAYLFNDQLLEVFLTKEKQTLRFRLPLEDDDKVAKIALSGRRLAVLVDGKPRVFTLGRKR